jgi:hypothetical protein
MAGWLATRLSTVRSTATNTPWADRTLKTNHFVNATAKAAVLALRVRTSLSQPATPIIQGKLSSTMALPFPPGQSSPCETKYSHQVQPKYCQWHHSDKLTIVLSQLSRSIPITQLITEAAYDGWTRRMGRVHSPVSALRTPLDCHPTPMPASLDIGFTQTTLASIHMTPFARAVSIQRMLFCTEHEIYRRLLLCSTIH